MGCGARECRFCLHDDLCRKCYYGHDHERHASAHAALQRDETVYTKKGDKKQHDAGRRLVENMDRNHLRPAAIRESLTADRDHQDQQASRDAVRRSRTKHLFEWCCEPDSLLMQEWLRGNRHGVRLALPDYDLSRAGVVNRVAYDMEDKHKAGDFVAVHISLPCTPWCTWHRIASSVGPDYAFRVEAQRKLSRNMLKLTISMLRRLLPYGPRFRVSFEWPRNSDGWNPRKCPEIRQLTQLATRMQHRRLRLRPARPSRRTRTKTVAHPDQRLRVREQGKPPVPRTSSS